jgi:glycosyltransferase involved in cell wall biosynthesis
VRLAGYVAPAVEREFNQSVDAMRAVGADVHLDLVTDGGVPAPADALATARCAVLPYRKHFGVSRVLMEAATVGTPVVGPEWGPNGSLIREYGLGLTADPADPAALRKAIFELCDDPHATAAYAANLSRYVQERGGARFRGTLRSAFGLMEPSPLPH